MKTRTLLLLSVATALAILLAGGVLLFQLSNEQNTVEAVQLGSEVRVGDVSIVVHDVEFDEASGTQLLGVAVTMGGTDDPNGLDSFRLVTGDRSLEPIDAPADGRCVEITTVVSDCRLDFDVGGSETSSRVLVMRRGDDQANWRLPAP
jgi:hypothetical protein